MNSLLPEIAIEEIANTYGPGCGAKAMYFGDKIFIRWRTPIGEAREIEVPKAWGVLSECAFRCKFADLVADKFYGGNFCFAFPEGHKWLNEMDRGDLLRVIKYLRGDTSNRKAGVV